MEQSEWEKLMEVMKSIAADRNKVRYVTVVDWQINGQERSQEHYLVGDNRTSCGRDMKKKRRGVRTRYLEWNTAFYSPRACQKCSSNQMLTPDKVFVDTRSNDE